MFYGNFGMFVRALAYIMANGPDGLRQTTEDAVLNANYIRKNWKTFTNCPIGRPRCTRWSSAIAGRRRMGSRPGHCETPDRLWFHPYTTSFR